MPLDHQAHPNCPDTLDCLPDTDGRPQHTLPIILRCAILGSPRKRLTIREIYAAMEKKYPYFRNAGPTWKQSVRHHLSLNRLFERQARPVTDPGFGSYWTVNLTAPPGTKRPRKRGRPATRDVVVREDGRSLPRMRRNSLSPITLPPIATLALAADRRLRRCHASTSRRFRPRYEEQDEGMFSGEDCRSEECESEDDDMLPPGFAGGRGIDPRPAFDADFSDPMPLVPASFKEEDEFDEFDRQFIQRLKVEIMELRRQAANLQSTTTRLSSQLHEVNADMLKAKSAQRTTEIMLQDEQRKRIEAERAARDEAMLRRAAEEVLRRMHTGSAEFKCSIQT